MKTMRRVLPSTLLSIMLVSSADAQIGDVKIGTDHPFYPGELKLATFEDLFATQAEQFERVTGIQPSNDHDRALAAWFFRNTHFAHGEEGKEDLWGKGFDNSIANTTRDYWTGLYAHGFGLCGTTHAQWTAELDVLFGACRSRVVGTAGHNSFEAYLTGGPYGTGQWAMLDHDLSTVIFDDSGERLLGLDAISANWKVLAKRDYLPKRQNGWLVCGLHANDGSSYAAYQTAEYLAGYAGPPPIVSLRPGESLRRYFEPGLDDGKTFVFWGRNYGTKSIPGPERSRTWVNQPEAMYGSAKGTTHVDGQARYGNGVYRWSPNFRDGSYRMGASDESDTHVTLEFFTPYIIGATPANDDPWGIYQPGCKNGLVLKSNISFPVSISTDGGNTWYDAGPIQNRLDLTDHAKGYRQYQLKLMASRAKLSDSQLSIETVCQLNPAMLPRLKDGGTVVRYTSGGKSLASFGPNKLQATPRIVAGALDTPRVTMEFKTPRGEPIRELYVAAHVASSNPPLPEIKYAIDCSIDGGKTWEPMLDTPSFQRRAVEPKDFWSQSLWGAKKSFSKDDLKAVQVRFKNDGGKAYLRAEGHLIYPTVVRSGKVTYSWVDNLGMHEKSSQLQHNESWQLNTGSQVRTKWVEISE